MVEQLINLKVYKDFTNYIIEHSKKHDEDILYLSKLKKEIRQCIRDKRNLNSYWRLTAYKLFKKRQIEDARVTDQNLLDEISFSFSGNDYKTAIRYMHHQASKMPVNGIFYENSLRKDEAEFVKETMVRFLESGRHIDTEKVYMYENGVVLFVANKGK